jgi:hypothetical protein
MHALAGLAQTQASLQQLPSPVPAPRPSVVDHMTGEKPGTDKVVGSSAEGEEAPPFFAEASAMLPRQDSSGSSPSHKSHNSHAIIAHLLELKQQAESERKPVNPHDVQVCCMASQPWVVLECVLEASNQVNQFSWCLNVHLCAPGCGEHARGLLAAA